MFSFHLGTDAKSSGFEGIWFWGKPETGAPVNIRAAEARCAAGKSKQPANPFTHHLCGIQQRGVQRERLNHVEPMRTSVMSHWLLSNLSDHLGHVCACVMPPCSSIHIPTTLSPERLMASILQLWAKRVGSRMQGAAWHLQQSKGIRPSEVNSSRILFL